MTHSLLWVVSVCLSESERAAGECRREKVSSKCTVCQWIKAATKALMCVAVQLLEIQISCGVACLRWGRTLQYSVSILVLWKEDRQYFWWYWKSYRWDFKIPLHRNTLILPKPNPNGFQFMINMNSSWMLLRRPVFYCCSKSLQQPLVIGISGLQQ